MLNVKFDYEANRTIAYTVYNTESKKRHSVIYRIDKNEWCCDCKWNTLKETCCSHINEVKKFIGRKKVQDIMKKLGN